MISSSLNPVAGQDADATDLPGTLVQGVTDATITTKPLSLAYDASLRVSLAELPGWGGDSMPEFDNFRTLTAW